MNDPDTVIPISSAECSRMSVSERVKELSLGSIIIITTDSSLLVVFFSVSAAGTDPVSCLNLYF